MSTDSQTPASDLMAAPFIHLRMHTEYSVNDSIVRHDDAIAAAVRDNMPALGISDAANLFGAVKFYSAARKAGLQPIIGCDCVIEKGKTASPKNKSNQDDTSRLLLVCANKAGFLNLSRLLTRAYTENLWRGKPQIKREWLAGNATNGLIAISGAHLGDIGQAIECDEIDAATSLAKRWAADFPDAFYIELQRIEGNKQEAYINAACYVAGQLNLPVVATHPIQFMAPEDFTAHEARVCIARGEVLGDPRRSKDFAATQYFYSTQQMQALFVDIPSALANSVEIAKRCNFQEILSKPQLPVFPTPNGETADDFLLSQSRDGLEARLAVLFPDVAKRDAVRPDYLVRLEFEASTISRMGFPGYFLIVADFIGWAKSNGVPVGPGRGSGAGSLVAYSLGITDLDPLHYGLLFERFLNPQRVSMPDFDIDFCQEGRERVIEYVKQRYGARSVSQISTFGTMAAKAVIRDVGRVLGMSYNYVDSIAKLIPNQLGITLPEAIKAEPQFNERRDAEEEVAQLLTLALKLEGIVRNVGTHAGGVLIAPGPLTDFTPLYVAEKTDGVVSQFDKDDVEAAGLVKFDLLGLTTLTILEESNALIRRRSYDTSKPHFDIANMPLNDAKSYEIFTKGNTVAIFQFESKGMRDLIVKAKPTSVDDLTALNALYRPGPMDLIPDYIKRKTGVEPIKYPDPRIEPILSPTCGIMVYQEQVMQIAQVIGGYSLGDADLLRRAMGKKKKEEMEQQRSIFVAGATKNEVAVKVATELFDFMEKFAGYGFNKSHSAAYSVLAYQTAYLKTYFPSEFMAANMSCVMDYTDKVMPLVDDCKANGIKVLAPDINTGTVRFEPTDASTIRYGLGAVKGTGRMAIDNIEMARKKDGPFKNLLDFVKRIDRHTVNRRAMEALIRSGAFDSMESNRAALLATLPDAVAVAEMVERDAQQVSLFDESTAEAGGECALANVPAWSERERLNNEKQALGFYLSGHPFNAYAREVRQFVRTPLNELVPSPNFILLTGILYEQRVRNGKRGKMCVLSLDDGSARVEVVAYSEVFDAKRALVRDDSLLIIRGKVSFDEFSGGNRVVADDIMDLEEFRKKFARKIELNVSEGVRANQIKRALAPHLAPNLPNSSNVLIHYRNGLATAEIALPEKYNVRVSDALVETLNTMLKPTNVHVQYDAAASAVPPAPRQYSKEGRRSAEPVGGRYEE